MKSKMKEGMLANAATTLEAKLIFQGNYFGKKEKNQANISIYIGTVHMDINGRPTVDVSPPIAYHGGTRGSLFGLQRMQNSTVNARDS